MIEKIIDFDGYNKVVVKSIYDNGEYLTDLFQIELQEDMNNLDTEPVEVEVRKDENISFAADNEYFSLTEEEIIILRPIIKNNEAY